MGSYFSTISARRTVGARLFAALLTVLAVSPFTAPFSTMDAAEIVGDQKIQADGSGLKVSQDVVDVSGLLPGLLPPHLDVLLRNSRLVDRPDVRPFLVLALRI